MQPWAGLRQQAVDLASLAGALAVCFGHGVVAAAAVDVVWCMSTPPCETGQEPVRNTPLANTFIWP